MLEKVSERKSVEQPLVSICCLTYNHAPFIRQCLDGFLMQETSFPVEILIHDDASTDGTDDIIREYAKIFPDILFPLFEQENQFSKPGRLSMDLYNYTRVRGRYVAYCEGDDFWKDPLKLQKQVDFLESHPDYSVCWHRCTTIDEDGHILSNDLSTASHSDVPDGTEITIDTVQSGQYVQPLTMVFRFSCLDLSLRKRIKYFRDTHENFFLLKAGKGCSMNFDGGCYRIHRGGMYSTWSRYDFCKNSLPIDREFYWKTRDKSVKKLFLETLEMCIQEYGKEEKWKACCSAVEYAFVSFRPKSLIRHFKTIFARR